MAKKTQGRDGFGQSDEQSDDYTPTISGGVDKTPPDKRPVSTDARMPGDSADPPADADEDASAEKADANWDAITADDQEPDLDAILADARTDAPEPGASGVRTCHRCSKSLRPDEGVERDGQWYCTRQHAFEGAGDQGDVALQDRPER